MPGHSRIVLLLKVALPSFVALFLGIIVLLPSIDDEINKIKIDIPTIDTTDKISFTMDKGNFYGQGKDNAIFSLNVENFKEDRDKLTMLFQKINGKIFLKDASWIEISTDKGNYKKQNNKFFMNGNIVINDSDNNNLYTDEAIIDLDDLSVAGQKNIRALTSFGNVESQGFYFKKNDKYLFTGKVKGFIDTSKIEKSK